jgi:tRNA-Thr(GGU) m(6)t(6)A37 methyltransferase TsaA
MNTPKTFDLRPIGRVHSPLKQRKGAPRQSWEGAPNAKLEIDPAYIEALDGIEPGQEIWILTWLHEAHRGVLRVHPRGEPDNAEKGVFATRSPDRPNPIGLHRARLLAIEQIRWLEVNGLEAIDGTPILDLKPVLTQSRDF